MAICNYPWCACRFSNIIPSLNFPTKVIVSLIEDNIELVLFGHCDRIQECWRHVHSTGSAQLRYLNTNALSWVTVRDLVLLCDLVLTS